MRWIDGLINSCIHTISKQYNNYLDFDLFITAAALPPMLQPAPTMIQQEFNDKAAPAVKWL